MNKEELKEKVEDFKCSVRTKYENFKCGVRQVYRDFKTWGDEHPAEALGVLGAGIMAISGITTTAVKAVDHGMTRKHVARLEKKSECDVYDNRTATHYSTKRPLSNVEKMYLEEEYQKGRNKSEVLQEMKLLK